MENNSPTAQYQYLLKMEKNIQNFRYIKRSVCSCAPYPTHFVITVVIIGPNHSHAWTNTHAFYRFVKRQHFYSKPLAHTFFLPANIRRVLVKLCRGALKITHHSLRMRFASFRFFFMQTHCDKRELTVSGIASLEPRNMVLSMLRRNTQPNIRNFFLSE